VSQRVIGLMALSVDEINAKLVPATANKVTLSVDDAAVVPIEIKFF